jgi:hypothetical protein
MRRALVTLALVPVAAVLAACGSSESQHGQPTARLERVGPSHVPTIVLTPVGMQRIGIQTAPVSALPGAPTPKPFVRVVRIGRRLQREIVHPAAPPRTGPTAIVPYSALVYESDGSPAVYTQSSPGVYTRATLSVAYISANNVFVNSGPPPGTRVVTVGAEELLGVENGVGAQT